MRLLTSMTWCGTYTTLRSSLLQCSLVCMLSDRFKCTSSPARQGCSPYLQRILLQEEMYYPCRSPSGCVGWQCGSNGLHNTLYVPRDSDGQRRAASASAEYEFRQVTL